MALLWLMAVGTLTCASLWADFTSTEETDERYNELTPKVFEHKPLFIIKCQYRRYVFEFLLLYYTIQSLLRSISIFLIVGISGVIRN